MLFPLGTIAAAIFRDRSPDAPAFVDTTDNRVTFGEAAKTTAAIAKALQAADVPSGVRIAFTPPRGPLGVLGFLASSTVGTCCPLNPRLRPEEMTRALTGMRIGALLDGGGGKATAERLGIPVVALNEAVRCNSGPILEGSEAPALLMVTSGTTSAPKLVPLSHGNILAAAGAIGRAFSLGIEDVCLNPMPLHHVHGLISAALSSLLAGSPVHCADGFNPAEFDAALRLLQPSWFTASPAMHLAMREHYQRSGTRPDAARLRFFRSSSAPLPASAIATLEALFDAPLIETYGLTETASMVCANPLPPKTRKPGSVGVAFGSEIRVVDAKGQLCRAEETGEIAIRGPSVITAYDENVSAGSFLDEWLLTGDIGRLDQDGYLFIVGRVKEVIKRGGLTVYPSEVDDALAADPAVAEAATFAVPHPTLGEDVVAAVVVRPGLATDGAALRAGVAGRLSSYKVPSVVLIVPSIPKNETGKMVRRHVAASLEDRLQPRQEPPADDAEAALLALWCDVLQRHDLGVTDNLFLFGADPLRARVVIKRLTTLDGKAVSLNALLSAPTVREQVSLVIAA
jgi:oxalate---CoA ligase